MKTVNQFLSDLAANKFDSEDAAVFTEAGWTAWVNTNRSLASRTKYIGTILDLIKNSSTVATENVGVTFSSQRSSDNWVYITIHFVNMEDGKEIYSLNLNNNDDDTLYSIRNGAGEVVATPKNKAELAGFFGVEYTVAPRAPRTVEIKPLNMDEIKAEIKRRLENVA